MGEGEHALLAEGIVHALLAKHAMECMHLVTAATHGQEDGHALLAEDAV